MPTYKEILLSKNALPRREVLEERERKQQKRIAEVKTEMELMVAKETAKLNEIREMLDVYKYSTQTLQFLASAEDVPSFSGVYSITHCGNPIYIGEAANCRARCITHAKSVLGNYKSETHVKELYNYMKASNLADFKFEFLEAVTSPTVTNDETFTLKKSRLLRESHHALAAVAAGHRLFNRALYDWDNLFSPEELEELRTSSGYQDITLTEALALRRKMTLSLMLEHYRLVD